MKTFKRYKFLRTSFKSDNGQEKWKLDQWKKYDGELEMCESGFHCSQKPYHAFSYVQGELLAEVEVRGRSIKQDDKEVWSEMRIVKVWKWQKKNSLALAIFSAELVLKNFEKEYPNDLRPKQAIEAAKKVLFRDTAKNRSAARSAAWSAGSAESVAWSAARSAAWSAGSAESVAWSAAWSAARSAAWSAESAESAARSAGSAARSAGSAAIKKIIKFFDEEIEKLERIK